MYQLITYNLLDSSDHNTAYDNVRVLVVEAYIGCTSENVCIVNIFWLSVENTLPGIGRNALYEPEAMECTFCTNYGAFKKDVLQTFKVTKLRMNIMPFKECAFL